MRCLILLLFISPFGHCREPLVDSAPWNRLAASKVEPDLFLPSPVSGTQILRPVMPKPMFVGPGPPYPNPDIPNLEVRNPGLQFLNETTIQTGVKILSPGCPVTASDPNPLGDLSLITDGERFGDDGYFAEPAAGKQWVQIDLEQSQRLHLIWICHYHKMPVSYRYVVIQISDDPAFKSSTTVYNADHDNSSGLGNAKDADYYESFRGRPIAFTPVKGRYVRLWSHGADVLETNCYIEVSVYGEPAAPDSK